MFYYKGNHCLYKIPFAFSEEECARLEVTQISEEEYNAEIALLENE